MRSAVASVLAALAVQQVAGHATFQQLWVNGIDQISSCVRVPQSNSPVTDVTGNSIRCNANKGSALTKCSVTAGTTVTVEIHQQAGDRSCNNEPIGGAHYGPVMVYLTSVADAATADGSTGWFKIFEDSWARAPGSANGDGDYWGVKDLTPSCGRMDVKIPTNIPSGDYLLRAEAIALHTAGSTGGAQFYMSCYQISVTGGSGTLPPTVLFPGAYKATDPGIKVDIHASMATYIAPGPTVVAGGTKKTAGTPGSNISGGGNYVTTVVRPPPSATSAPGGGGGGSCTAAKYEQCGGQGWTGCTTCVSGTKCNAVSGIYYSQCQ